MDGSDTATVRFVLENPDSVDVFNLRVVTYNAAGTVVTDDVPSQSIVNAGEIKTIVADSVVFGGLEATKKVSVTTADCPGVSSTAENESERWKLVR